jgi:hypothetical protein
MLTASQQHPTPHTHTATNGSKRSPHTRPLPHLATHVRQLGHDPSQGRIADRGTLLRGARVGLGLGAGDLGSPQRGPQRMHLIVVLLLLLAPT